LPLFVPRTSEGIDLASFIEGHLGYDVCRRTKTVKSEAPTGTRLSKGAVSDQACTEQRSGLDRGVCFRDRDAEPIISNRVFGISAV
jgi:hypothetical protein